jgi:hypothetical protein
MEELGMRVVEGLGGIAGAGLGGRINGFFLAAGTEEESPGREQAAENQVGGFQFVHKFIGRW